MSPPNEQERRQTPDLTVHVITLFPHLFDSWQQQGVVARAVDRGVVRLDLVELRPHGMGRHKVTDDYPFGGGPGMVMKPEPLFSAVESLGLADDVPRILLSPGGRRFDQRAADELAQHKALLLIAGHYEGVDHRVREHLATDEISIGDYVLSSGELAAMVVTDAVVRLVPGVLAEGSAQEESFVSGLLEYPQYTRPAAFRAWAVPDVLLSGHHGEVERWRRTQALRETFLRRPELLADASLGDADRALLDRWASESPDAQV